MKIDTHVYDILAELADGITSYLGVGVQEGVCVEHVAIAAPQAELTLVDTWGKVDGGTGRGSHDHVEARLHATGHLGRRVYYDGDSRVVLPRILPELMFDLAFVDGGHDEDVAYADLTHTWPHVGRAMVVHDIHFPSVAAAFWRWAVLAEGVEKMRLYPFGTGTVVVTRE